VNTFEVVDRPAHMLRRRGNNRNGIVQAVRETATTGKALFIPANGKPALRLQSEVHSMSQNIKKDGLRLVTRQADDKSGVYVWAVSCESEPQS